MNAQSYFRSCPGMNPFAAFMMLCLLPWGMQMAQAQTAADTKVYYAEGKKRVHVADCKRYQAFTLEQKNAMVSMTFAEAEAKELPLCSRCPGSTTPRDSESEAATLPKGVGDTTVYYAEGKKRVHIAACKRYQLLSDEERAAMVSMTLGEADAKGLPPCSRCPVDSIPTKTSTTATAPTAPTDKKSSPPATTYR